MRSSTDVKSISSYTVYYDLCTINALIRTSTIQKSSLSQMYAIHLTILLLSSSKMYAIHLTVLLLGLFFFKLQKVRYCLHSPRTRFRHTGRTCTLPLRLSPSGGKAVCGRRFARREARAAFIFHSTCTADETRLPDTAY